MNRPLAVIQAIQKRYTDMLSVLDERGRRLFAAAEARAYGLGGAYVVEQAKPTPLRRGAFVGSAEDAKKTTRYPALIDDLKNIVDSATRGDPMSPLLWISRSLEHVTEALRKIGYALSTFVVLWTLKSLGYRLRPGNALWCLQHHPKQRLGQRRNQFRHRALRGEHAAAVVVELRRTGVRGHARSLGECGWRRQQRIERSFVENVPSRICQRNKYSDHRLSLPPRHQQNGTPSNIEFAPITANWRAKPPALFQRCNAVYSGHDNESRPDHRRRSR